MKKCFLFLLLLLTLASSSFPCCMEDGCTDDITQQENPAHPGHEDKGPCSPFFACGTCAASIDLNSPGVVLTETQPCVVKHQSVYRFLLSSYTSSFFQPPRMS